VEFWFLLYRSIKDARGDDRARTILVAAAAVPAEGRCAGVSGLSRLIPAVIGVILRLRRDLGDYLSRPVPTLRASPQRYRWNIGSS
jgi:hypothetical protein